MYTIYMDVHIPDPWISERAKTLKQKETMGFNAHLAVFLTKKFGSMGMFYLLIVWMFGWIALATLGVGLFKQDPYPFVFLLFLSNVVQLLSLPILAVGQQVLSRASDKQAQQTYKDAEAILRLQDEVHRLIKINNEMTSEIHTMVTKR
jgi:uncharacterized membrane protein